MESWPSGCAFRGESELGGQQLGIREMNGVTGRCRNQTGTDAVLHNGAAGSVGEQMLLKAPGV